jgi:CoA:oxalate CoA-transferase
VDFTTMIAGAYATRLLADQGADVIKIEAPDGDPMRKRQPVREGASTYFGSLNVGKRSVVLNLAEPSGHQAALDLVRTADVVVENFRPGVMKRLGLDFETLIALEPDLIYISISGYGQTGAMSTLPAYAPILHAMSGFDLANLDYQLGAERPASTGIFIADVMAAMVTYGAVLTGLQARSTSGHGGYFDVTLLETMLALLPFETQNAQAAVPTKKTVYRPVRAGAEFVIIAPVSERTFAALGTAIGRPELITDARFAAIPDRERNWEQLWQIVEQWSAPLDADTVLDLLREAGCPCGRYRSVKQVLDDPALIQRGALRPAEDSAGAFLVTASPVMSPTWPQPREAVRVPSLGADTVAVLRDVAGYPADRAAEFEPRSGAAAASTR